MRITVRPNLMPRMRRCRAAVGGPRNVPGLCFMGGAGSGDAAVRQRPVEGDTRIGLAPGRDVAVPGKTGRSERGIGSAERGHHLRQGVVLTLVIGNGVGALELNADREVVARLPAFV